MHHTLHPRWNGRHNLRDCGRIFVQDRDHGVRRRRLLECPLAREHFVEKRADGEDIGAVVDAGAAHLLGGHVTDCAHHESGLGGVDSGEVSGFKFRLALNQFGETEVQDFNLIVLSDEQVFRFKVAMNDAPVNIALPPELQAIWMP